MEDLAHKRWLASAIGTLLSLLLAAIVASYSYQKLDVLIGKKGDEIMMTELPYFYSDDD